MKKLFAVVILGLIFLTTLSAFAQNKIFIYNYKFIPHSTNHQNVKDELMILNIQKDRSEFYSSERYSSDSTQLAEIPLLENEVVFSR